jgi:hypothetical protein
MAGDAGYIAPGLADAAGAAGATNTLADTLPATTTAGDTGALAATGQVAPLPQLGTLPVPSALAPDLQSAALRAAAKSAITNGGMTALKGGSLSDVLKSGAIGAISGGVGGAAGAYSGSNMLGSAAGGAVGGGLGAAAGGGNALQGALAGGVGGAVKGFAMPSVQNALSGSSPTVADTSPSGLSNVAALTPGNVAALDPQGGAPSALNEYLNTGASDNSTPGGSAANSGGGHANAIDGQPEITGTFNPSAYQEPTVIDPSAQPADSSATVTGQLPPGTPTTNEFGNQIDPGLANTFRSPNVAGINSTNATGPVPTIDTTSNLNLTGWGQIASAVGGSVLQGQAATDAKNKAIAASQQAAGNAQASLGTANGMLTQQQPLIGKIGTTATNAAGLDAQLAQQQADRSATAWNQNQAVTQGPLGQMSLNAMGAQYLSPEDTARLSQLQQIMATGSAAEKASAQTEMAGLQKKAVAAGVGLEQAKGQNLVSDAATQAAQVQGAYGKSADAITNIGDTAAKSTLADSAGIQQQMLGLGDARRADQTGFYNDQAAQTKAVAKQRADDNTLRANTQADADIANSADQANRQLLRLGGDPNKMAAMAAETANQQQLARIGSGNQVAATNIANLNAADDTARGLQTTGFNAGTAQQYQQQNSALTAQSSALDAARALRTNAATTAAGQNLTGDLTGINVTSSAQNAATALGNNAQDKVNSTLTGMQGNVANYGNGLSATSTANANGATTANTAATNNLNTAINAPNGTVQNINSATGNTTGASNAVSNASKIGLEAGVQQNSALGQATGATATKAVGNVLDQAGNSAGNAIGSTVGNAVGSVLGKIGSSVGDWLLSSSKTYKVNKAPVDQDQILDGLAAAAPKAYNYKPGIGTPGRKVGAMAEDLNEQFGDAVAPGGKAVNVQNLLGLQHAAINALGKRVKQLEHRKGR